VTRTSSWHLGEAVSIATSSLWTHKLRSVLTLIGVVMGVAAVIAVVSGVSRVFLALSDRRNLQEIV
jgi:putative ABC transport system permease protein